MTTPRKVNGIEMAVVRQIEAHRASVERTCHSKRRYADEFACRAEGLYWMQREGTPLFIYKCKVCRGWHLTRQEQPAYFAVDYLEKKAYK